VEVRYHPAALQERDALPVGERQAIQNAVEKLVAIGIQLGAPHSSQIKGSEVRELRPRAGRSAWRAFYARVGEELVVLAVGPEAQQDRKGFTRAVSNAERRLAELR
jgi:hypothetical protein